GVPAAVGDAGADPDGDAAPADGDAGDVGGGAAVRRGLPPRSARPTAASIPASASVATPTAQVATRARRAVSTPVTPAGARPAPGAHSPSKVPSPTATSASAMRTPNSTACDATGASSGRIGLVARNTASWAWIDVGLLASKKCGSASFCSPANRNVPPRNSRG